MSMKPGDTFIKDPDSTEPIGFDWTDYLAELGAGVTISSSSWVIAGDAALSQANASILAGSLKTQVFIAAGTLGTRSRLTNRIVTNSSPAVTDDRSITVLVQQQ